MMLASFGTVENHREREKGVLVYPVYSRRAGGLSIGINLFPDRKRCPFDCPYCEVFPFETNAVFSLDQMEADLRRAINDALERNIAVKDLCFSGNGEPSLSFDFIEALQAAVRIRTEMIPSAELVLISNGAGLLQPGLLSLLSLAASGATALNIWLKIDAGTPAWYDKMNRSAITHEKLIAAIKEFAAKAPFTIQTMLCAIDGQEPPPEEAQAWEQLVLELAAIAAAGSGGIKKIQIYGKARPSPQDPKAQPLSVGYLEERAASISLAFSSLFPVPCSPILVEVYP